MEDNNPIRDVWASNLEEEIAKISELIEDYPFIAMDTEFPGTIVQPEGEFKSKEAFNYQLIRLNVDLLKIIQIGITIGDGKGGYPSPCCSWQFNFKFNPKEDMYQEESIELLKNSSIDFERFTKDGISPYEFTQLLYTSGLVMNDQITYLTFHSSSDFGYLVKMLTCQPLPPDDKEFFAKLKILFPHFYDIKYITDDISEFAGLGLQALSSELNVTRIGPQHQAGSDALVTLMTFTELMKRINDGNIVMPSKENLLHGISPQ